MQEDGKSSGLKILRWGIALGSIAAVVVVTAVAGGSDSAWYLDASPVHDEAGSLPGAGAALSRNESDLSEGETRLAAASDPDPPVSDSDLGSWKPVFNDEALPCTGDRQPVNFETFSVGPSVDGLPLTYTERRCGGGPVATRVNYLSYVYGDCEIVEGATGCQPPLEIQTWPACQRFLAKYSFRGKPLPHRRLEKRDGAEVVEFNFALDKRIEVYTGSSTVVIFAVNRALATRAVEVLRLEGEARPPATHPDDLASGRPSPLEPPAEGSLEGDLSCHA